MSLPRLAAAAVAAALAALGSAQAQPDCMVPPLSMAPLTDAANFLTLPAAMNGRRVTLLLDTGATAGLVTPDAALRLNLPILPGEALRLQGTGGEGAVNQIVRITRLDIGSLGIEGVPAPIGALPQVPHVTPPVAGLIGGDVLSHFDVEIDVPGHRLALYPKRDARCTHPIGWTGAFETVSLARDGDRLLADAELDGHAVSALIDTGARSVIVNVDAAARIGLDTKVLGAEPGGMAGGVDPHEVLYHWHRFATLRIGQETLRDPVLTVAPLQERADVLLGASWFATHRVWLSYADARMFVQAVRDRAPIR